MKKVNEVLVKALVKKLSKTQLKIINSLENSIHVAGLAKKLAMNFSTIYMALRDLEKLGIIKTEKIGGTRLVSLTEVGIFLKELLE